MIDLPTAELSKDEPVGQLPPQEWLAWEETRAVVAALSGDGTAVRFVGGCVRDSLLKRAIHDIDIATPDEPPAVIARLRAAGFRVVPSGLAYGTVTAIVGRRSFEITSLRRDIETFGRRARVAFTRDWGEDSARRDFTINAVYCRPDGAIYDPQEGLPDLAAGRIRFVGNAAARINEDVLRLLRYFRFYAHYGKPPADSEALAACRAHAPRLQQLSGERLYGELRKILSAPDPGATCLIMQGARVLSVLLPEAKWIGRLRMLSFLESRGLVQPGIAPDALRRLAVLIEGDAGQVAALATRFKLSRADAARLLDLVAAPLRPAAGIDDKAARRLLHRLGSALFRDLTLLEWAASRDRSGHSSTRETAQWMHLLDLAAAWSPRRLPLRGKDIVDRGVPSGPAVGAVLAALEQWWEDSDFSGDRGAALAALDRHLQRG